MRIRIANLFLLASLLWLFCSSLSLAQEAIVFKGIDCRGLAFSSDGKWLAAAGQKPPKSRKWESENNGFGTGTLVKVWDLGTRQEVFHYDTDDWEAVNLALSPTAALLAVSFCPKRQPVVEFKFGVSPPPVPVMIWDLKKGKKIRTLFCEYSVHHLRFSPDGKTVATDDSGKGVILWDVDTGEKRAMIEAAYSFHALEFSPDGKMLAFSGEKTKEIPGDKFGSLVELRVLENNKAKASFPVKTAKTSDSYIAFLAFSPNGELFALGRDKMVQIYDLRREKIVTSIQAYTGPYIRVAFSPDSKILYTGGSDGKVGQWEPSWKAWDPSSARLLHTQKCPAINSLAVSPDGQRLATGGHDTVTLWTLPKDFGKSK
jgi:WD40 repeat protein